MADEIPFSVCNISGVWMEPTVKFALTQILTVTRTRWDMISNYDTELNFKLA